MKQYENIIARNFRISLFEKDKNHQLSFSNLKYLYDYPMICNIVDSLPDEHSCNMYTYGCTIPKNIEHISNSKILYRHNNLEAEINWILLSIRKYQKEVNLFLTYREQYEKHLILGDYENAEIILDKIEA